MAAAFGPVFQTAEPLAAAEVERLSQMAWRGMELDSAGDYAAALPLLEEAHATISVAAPVENRLRLNVAISLAHTLKELGRRDEAIVILAQADAALAAAGQDVAVDAPGVATALAWLLYDAERFPEAGGAADRACRLYAMPGREGSVQRCARLDRIRAAAGRADLPASALAEAQAERDFAEMRAALDARDFPTAEAAMGRLSDWFAATSGPDHPDTLMMLTLRAGLMTRQGRVEEARAAYADLYPRHLRTHGPAHEATVDLLEDYAEVLGLQDASAEAMALLDSALAEIGSVGDGAPEAVIRLQTARGARLAAMGRRLDADAAFAAAVEASSGLGPTDAVRLDARVNQASHLLNTERGQQALALVEALIAEQAALGVADSIPVRSARLVQAEALTLYSNRLDEAGDILEGLLVSWPAGERRSAQSRATALILMGAVRFQQGDLTRSEASLIEGLEILAMAAPRSGLMMRGQRMRGLLLIQTGQIGAAGEILRDTVRMEAEILGEDNPESIMTLTGLAQAQQEQGALDTARATMARAVSMAERAYGPLSLSAATAYNQASLMEWRQDEFVAARALSDQAVTAYRAALGPDHPLTLTAEVNQAALMAQTGQRAEAAAAYQDLIDRRQRVLGADHPDLASMYHTIALQMQPEVAAGEAERLLRRSVDIADQRLTRGDPDRMLYQTGLAWQLLRMDRVGEAMPILRDVGRQATERSGALQAETIGQTEVDRMRDMFRGLVTAAWTLAN